MKLSKKVKIFSEFCTAFLKATFDLKHFENEDESHRSCLSKVIDCKIRAYVNV